jgi:hypothetical protein
MTETDLEYCQRRAQTALVAWQRPQPPSADMDASLRLYWEYLDAIQEPDLTACRRLRERDERMRLTVKTAILTASACAAVAAPTFGAVLFAPWIVGWAWKTYKKSRVTTAEERN